MLIYMFFVHLDSNKGDEGSIKSEMPALLRVKMWLGLEADEKDWYLKTPEAELSIFAETYENQVNARCQLAKNINKIISHSLLSN